MTRATALRKVKRTLWREFMYRMDWFVWGIVGAVVVAFIPLVGPLISVGVVLAMLWKVFGFRETQLVGDCPVCTKQMPIQPESDVLACPVCNNVMAVRENALILLDVH